MSSYKHRHKNSKLNLHFTSLLPSSVKDGSKSLSIDRVNNGRHSIGCTILSEKQVTFGSSINLPPVETKKNFSNKNCVAVDLLQLADKYSKSSNDYSGRRRHSKASGDGFARPTIGEMGEITKQTKFCNSIGSAPESCLKQKQFSVLKQPYGQTAASNRLSEDRTSSFASSWPMMPYECETKASNRLPEIGTNDWDKNKNKTRDLREIETEVNTENQTNIQKEESDQFYGGFAKFNKSRLFRMRQMQAHGNIRYSSSCNEINSPSTKDMPNIEEQPLKQASKIKQIKLNDSSNVEIVNTKFHANSCISNSVSLIEKQRVGMVNQLKQKTATSTDSELTNVTDESISKELPSKDFTCYDENSYDNLDRKCMKWLEDVARECSQNPDKKMRISTKMLRIICVFSAALMCFSRSSPVSRLKNHTTHSELSRHQHHLEVHFGTERLRRLDHMLAQLEKNTLSRGSLTTNNNLAAMTTNDISEKVANTLEVREKSLQDGEQSSIYSEKAFSMIALPYKFRRYDLNQDSFVTVVELADATGTLLEDAVEPFNKADINSDGLLTEEELHSAPWVFDMHKGKLIAL